MDLLRDVSFSLSPGSLTFLTGPSGSGKSTLLRLCYGQEMPLHGDVTVLGSDLGTGGDKALSKLRHRIGIIFQNPGFVGHLSVFDNVALPLRLAGRKAAAYAKDVHELLTWAGLGTKIHESAITLSAGERQRMAIARAVAGKPDLLLADEPLAGLDDDAGSRMMRLLLNIHRFGTTVLIASRDRNEAAKAGARELRLLEGYISEVEPGT
jgi:cell division transport system ATP-binding protein